MIMVIVLPLGHRLETANVHVDDGFIDQYHTIRTTVVYVRGTVVRHAHARNEDRTT